MGNRELERFIRTREQQRQRREELERGAVEAFSEWIGETIKQFVKNTVDSFWTWFRGLFGR